MGGGGKSLWSEGKKPARAGGYHSICVAWIDYRHLILGSKRQASSINLHSAPNN